MVKRIGYLHDKLCTEKNIALADKNARIGKNGSRKYIREHDKNRKQEDLVLLASFINGTYKTSKYDNYIIYEPKKRIISKLPYYPDRIAHHAIMNIMKPIWISQMTNFTYANIKGRGIHACMKDISRTLYKTKNTDATKYYLKLDIRKFYPNISHDILKNILKRKIKDNKMLNILFEIIDSFEYNGEDKYTKDVSGLPLGNYPGGYECNLYLTSLDRWIKEELKIKYVFRYADDILIFYNNKEYLHKVLIAIKFYVKEVLHIEIKPNYYIAPVDKRPIDYIGYVFTHTNVRVRKRIKNRLKKVINDYNKGNITKSKFIRIIPSYYGWLTHANCKHLLSTIIDLIKDDRNVKAKDIINKITHLKSKDDTKPKASIKTNNRRIPKRRGITNTRYKVKTND